jgi:hypothetical protein
MTSARAAILISGLALVSHASCNAVAQSRLSHGSTPPVLSLSFANNGQHVSAREGQQIEISLGTVGPRQYGTPEISSASVRLMSTAQDWPPTPGGPAFVYIFEAVAEGETQLRVPVINNDPALYTNDITFTITINVVAARGRRSTRHDLLTPDQANTAPWQNAWTNLNNFVRQTFTPSRPRLTGVEVELVVANPGPGSAEVSMMVLNEAGVGVARVFKTVTAAECEHVMFLLPHGGLPVIPGQVYSIVLSGGDNLFGWKYVVAGYGKGAAFFNNKPLLKGAHSTFLFRTFGAS